MIGPKVDLETISSLFLLVHGDGDTSVVHQYVDFWESL
jgi:hypothetical protein